MDISSALLATLRTDRKSFEARCESIGELLERSDKAVMVALVRIYDRQTADEKNAEATVHDNGVGFQSCDAKAGSYYARLVKAGYTLFADRMPRARRMTIKYRRQLAVLSFEKDLAAAKAAESNSDRMARIEAEEYQREHRKSAFAGNDEEPDSGRLERLGNGCCEQGCDVPGCCCGCA